MKSAVTKSHSIIGWATSFLYLGLISCMSILLIKNFNRSLMASRRIQIQRENKEKISLWLFPYWRKNRRRNKNPLNINVDIKRFLLGLCSAVQCQNLWNSSENLEQVLHIHISEMANSLKSVSVVSNSTTMHDRCHLRVNGG